jgi:S1-C subfamily serine protease
LHKRAGSDRGLPPSIAQKYSTSGSSSPETQDKSGKIKVALDTSNERHDVLSPIQLFKTLAPDIYIVNAKRTNGDEFQGSAVAVSSTDLLTNCHVVVDSSSITLEQKDSVTKAALISANVDADRCVLRSDRPLAAFAPIRPYDSLQVGEKVYSIGAPAGLELTISDGLLSGKRTTSDRRLVQTTAAISPGSSGGGLFDEAGNLIGITTFRLKDTENLNFAISAEDYLSRWSAPLEADRVTVSN